MLLKPFKCLTLALAFAAAQCASAFTLWGPIEAWQTADLDYSNPAGSTRYYYTSVAREFSSVELGGPKNFGAGSRLTTPILTYGYDDTFLTYYGAKGVAAVDSAFQTLNALPSASSANLNNFLTDGAMQINYTAQALGLYDLKSGVLYLMAEHMGLLGETHVFDLAGRGKYGTPACDYEYAVINRNYDPITYDPSDYVNGHLFGYVIWDGCQIGVSVGDAIEVPQDATATRYTAIASAGALQPGTFYLNFTRDDMGGIKQLYAKNNYFVQQLDSDSIVTGSTDSTYNPASTNGDVGVSNFVGLVGGVEKITFVKVAYDSILGTGFTPRSYNYTIPYVTNSQHFNLQVTRTVVQPDIIFTASNLLVNASPLVDFAFSRSGTFIASPYPTGGAALPATIVPNEVVTFNNIGATLFNLNPGFMDNLDIYFNSFAWGSFDGSTNAPVVFPQGSSLASLEAQVTEGVGSAPVSPWNPALNPNTNATVTSGSGAAAAARVR